MEYPSTLNKEHSVDNSNYITLFLPGLPGAYRNRPLINDLISHGCDIYSVTYNGTNNRPGTLTPDSVFNNINTALKYLDKLGKPILVISYSFSTLFVESALKNKKNIFGLLMFSPIFDLKQSVSHNIKHELNQINSLADYYLDVESFKNHLLNESSYQKNTHKILASLSTYSFPVILAVGDNDQTINIEKVNQTITDYREKNTYNSLFHFPIPDATHRLDTIYAGGDIKRIIDGLFFSLDLSQSFSEISSYAWGASLNSRYSRSKTDVDIAIVGEKFTYNDYLKINQLIANYAKKYSVEIDVIVNTFKEMASDKRIRSNRGPSFIHEINYYYTPYIQGKKYTTIPFDAKKIIRDGKKANKMNIYKSKKALLNYPPGSSASNVIMKNFIYGCFYHQYLIGNFYVDQNNIEKYYKDNDQKVMQLLEKIRDIKKLNYSNIKLDFLKEVLESHEQLDV